MDLEDIKNGVIIGLGVLVFIGILLFMIMFISIKIDVYTTREKIKIYQETNIIDEDTKKILIEKLDV